MPRLLLMVEDRGVGARTCPRPKPFLVCVPYVSRGFHMASYLCPFCNQHQAITSPKQHQQVHKFYIEDNAEGPVGAAFNVLSCANPTCRKTTVNLTVGRISAIGNGSFYLDVRKPVLLEGRIIPAGVAREYPDFIPAPLLEDYREACLVKDLSPKAAATLVRRCLQGMIRDFCGIKKNRLVDEVAELKRLVDEDAAPKGVSYETVAAIDHVREIGNIGAHMEKDIDLIIPVEPDEAAILIELVEMLFEEWYLARHRREERLSQIKGAREEKQAMKAAKPETGGFASPS